MTATTGLNITLVDSAQSGKEVTVNIGTVVIDAALSALAHVLTDADYTLSTSTTPPEWNYGAFIFTGTLTAGRNIIVPTANKKMYVVSNGTAQTLTVKTSGGTGIAIATGKTAIVLCNGTNVVRVTADV